MKKGRTITELAGELERQAKSKKDFVAPTTALEIEEAKIGVGETKRPFSLVMGTNGDSRRFGVTDICHNQIAERMGIPKKYYDRMRDAAPKLLEENVNHWLRSENKKQMVRTLDGRARAFLSDRYRPLDNYDLAEVALPAIHDAGCRIESAEVTDTRFYIKAVTERVQMEVKKGDVVQAGIVISNSEIGFGAVKVEPLIYRLVCSNGMISNDYGMRRHHIGRSGGSDIDMAEEFFRNETRIADDKAFWMKVRDVVKGSFDQINFRKIVEGMSKTLEIEIQRDPVWVVQDVTDKFGLSEGERTGVLKHLIQGGDLTGYGLVNAVTRTSQDVESYDRATELERLGGEIITLPENDWAKLCRARG